MIIEGNKYIHFELWGDTGKTQLWRVINKSGCYQLGLITWFGSWRQYVFQPVENTEYNNTCLITITNFINHLNKEKRVALPVIRGEDNKE